jgi:hypothetical protein
MDGDTIQFTRPPVCEICGSTGHTDGHHDSTSPMGHVGTGTPPTEFATEEVVIEDDDNR